MTGLLAATKIPAVIDADALEHTCCETGALAKLAKMPGRAGGADTASRRDGAAGGDHEWPKCRPTG